VKRFFDIFFSFFGLLFLLPLFIIVAVLIKVNSDGPVFFRQERIGKDFRTFRIFKFRTMSMNTKKEGSLVTVAGDKRVTKIGALLRKTKIDELPQLLNVLKGDMSLVGPRPEVKKYVDLFKAEYKKLLTIKPGITDPASIKYSEEERVLALSQSWEDEYIKKVLPEKIRLSMTYVEDHNIVTDVKLILRTIMRTSQ
jgi:lipopolysaccharide/colanic/teichoic acid biosynthesis glycosyltransferase